ncbi:MAG TPA: PQQ-dependent sugar dehydrogenase [Gemmatimonadales bacterium]|nr:PQQ-dependent sugar dehydrogenase [Gemmatimonadales bacterium]
MTTPKLAVVARVSLLLIPGLTPLSLVAQQPQWVLPAGFHVTVFADSVENAREMALGPRGTVFVGSFRAGKVHAVIDRDGDHKADRVVLIASGLDQPNGVAIRNGALYVATASKLLRFDDIERRLDSAPAPVVVRDSLPNSKDGHTWKFIAFGPDSLLYMSVGAPCNVCLSPPMVSTILRMKPDGSNLEVFAEGVRNSVGFDWHPVSRELWFTDNGRDMLGDDVPSDELNVAWKPGLHFGFPFCHQGDVSDPQFGAQRACSTTEAPVQKLDAHVAALGFTFYTGDMFPASYKNAVIIAQHGSWNRSVPSGYRVMVARTNGRQVTRYETFLDGFLPNRSSAPGGWGAAAAALGRPVDVLQMPDGSVLISDDKGNRLLRVSYARAQDRTHVTINDTGVVAENVTSSRDGTVYFGSMAKGTIYRAAPGAAHAEPWILASTAGLTRVLGVLADDKTNTLWVCQNSTGGRDGRPVAGQTALRSFDLTSGVAKNTYPFPPSSGVCNDIAVSADGGVYASESFGGRVHRLKPGATALEVWTSDERLNVIDGLAFLADGSLYVNTFDTGKLFRIPVKPDGSAGPIVPIETSMPLVRPDGLRSVGPRTLIQAEQQGRVAELTISGDRAEVRVLQDGLTRASGVTLIGNTALVLVELARAVVVPYRPR